MTFEGLGSIGQVHVSVSDLDRAVRFYRDALGLPLLFTVPGQEMAFLDAGGVRLYLGVPEAPEFRSNPLLYFRVPDIQEAHRALVGRGVRFREEPHVVHRAEGVELWMAFFVDPDGTTLALMSERGAPDSGNHGVPERCACRAHVGGDEAPPSQARHREPIESAPNERHVRGLVQDDPVGVIGKDRDVSTIR